MTRSTIRAAIRGRGGLAVLAAAFLMVAPGPAAADIEREDLIKEADFLTQLVLERIRLQCFVRRSEPNKSVSCPRDTWATGGGIEIVPTQADGSPVFAPQPAATTATPPPAPPAAGAPAPVPAAAPASAKLPPAVKNRPDVEGGATAKTGWTCENQDGRPPPPFVPESAAASVAAGKVPPPPPATMCYVICCEIVDAKKAQPRSRRKMR